MDPLIPSLNETWMTWVVAGLFVVGIIGTLIPAVPGLSVIIASVALYAAVHGLHGAAFGVCIAIVLLCIIGEVANFVLPGRRANKVGANGWSVFCGVIGAVIGLFAIPVIGFAVGGALGIYIAEIAQGRSNDAAWAATKETLIGIGISMIVQFFIAMLSLGLWLIWVFAL